ncbi:MAG: dTDP-4-amino-4,6-dideoxygalactose transaminase [Bacteroidia bacterium]
MISEIPFNKAYLTGKEADYFNRVLYIGSLSGKEIFGGKCLDFFSNRYTFKNAHLTTSCTSALEISAILSGIKQGDEVILPSYTYVTTATAFVLRGAKIIFADSLKENPNIDVSEIEKLITPKTRAIVAVHYAGIACDMDRISALAAKYNLFVIEDAAHAIDAFYKNRPLGSLGHFGALSFHETKNITCGEGGLLILNDDRFFERAEIVLDKGTNRRAFMDGQINKYEWVDLGSSFRLSETAASFLLAQLEAINFIQQRRLVIWNRYFNELKELDPDGLVKLPVIPDYAEHNASIFYLVCNHAVTRAGLIARLSEKGIAATFHYQPLHLSPYYLSQKNERLELPNAELFGDCLVRLPLYPSLTDKDVDFIVSEVKNSIREL